MTRLGMRRFRIPAAALLLLRVALPVCVITASCVAAFGLFRDVSKTAPQAASQPAPSLRLGAGPGSPAAPSAPPATPVAAPASEPLTAPVEVFNASGVSGLAERTAEALRLRGVDVAKVGNLAAHMQRHPASQQTAGLAVYYPSGIRGQAQTLARVSGAATIAPAPSELTSAGTLVLVLTDARAAAVAALISYVP
jgi:ABC-type phosphate/phosphonate transport system substrate-binding protein